VRPGDAVAKRPSGQASFASRWPTSGYSRGLLATGILMGIGMAAVCSRTPGMSAPSAGWLG
jgi:hypothetical protein